MNLSSSALDDGYLARQLNEIDLDALAKKTGFCLRRARKLGPALFLSGVLALGASGCQSLRQRAIVLGLLSHQRISKQALFKRCNHAASLFLQATLGALIGQMPRAPLRHAASALGSFARVLIQDSTTIALHPRLARFFPGSAHPRATLASLKIQAIFDLCQSTFLGFELGSFRRNDQAASPLILHYCAAGDLVIRDLGYFVLPVLRAIAQKKAFFLSRLRADCVLYAPEGEEPLDLLAILRRQTRFEGWVRAGKQEKLPARLIAVPLPEGVAAERRRKAGANRDRRLHPSKASLALLGWEIFITNAEGEHLCPDQISALYGLRWRIETLFKAFKSHFALAHAPSHVSKNGVELFIYSKLLFIALFCLRAPLPSCRAPATRSASLSLLKLAQASALLLLPLALMPALGGSRPTAVSIASQLRYHCAYEERRRIHFGQCLQSLS